MKQYGEKTFATRKELIQFLVANKSFEISRRKSAVKFSDPITNLLNKGVKMGKANKGVLYSNDEDKGILQRTLIVNTYLWKDSYYDVHLPGTFTRSIAAKGVEIPPINQHKFDLDNILGKTLSISENSMPWKSLGIDKAGDTIGVVTETEIKRDKNPARYDDYLNETIKQHSVGMIYLQCAFACDDEDYPLEYELYSEWIDKLGNQADVEEDGFFFAVMEAKLLEYSCVIAGANELTPVLYPSKDTTKSGDPSRNTLKALNALANKLEFINIINNL